MDPTSTRPTYQLQEWKSLVCRLSPADVAYLLDVHRTHLTLSPTGKRDQYRLISRGYVGCIQAPDCRLIVQPKVPLGNLFLLLNPKSIQLGSPASPGGEQQGGVVDFLAIQLARLMQERVKAGLHREYVERTSADQFLRGRLDLQAQMRELATGSNRIHSRFDELTTEIPCNQFPRRIARQLLRSPLLGDLARQELHVAVQSFAQVTMLPGEESETGRLQCLRAPEQYRPLLDLCQTLDDALRHGEQDSKLRFPSFLVAMERVFERYVMEVALAAADPELRVEIQEAHYLNHAGERKADLQLRPDVVIYQVGKPCAVLDAKWKWRPGIPFIARDVHQAIAYAAILGVEKTLLVYPGRRDCFRRYPLRFGSGTFEIRKLRVIGSAAELAESSKRLTRALRK
jgi:5-methylcytosine-specific restriction enzyme subunit McrC